MAQERTASTGGRHAHVFLGRDHARNERNLWAVIGLCSAMMIAEIVGGALFGSIALIADGFHMSTHAGALLLAGLAYRLARRHADDPRLTFGSGKFGDLAGFASAILLAAVGAGIAYEALARLIAPQPIAFAQAIPIAALGLIVNVASAWLLTRGGHDHGRAHGHGHDHAARGERVVELGGARLRLEIFEDGVPPRFRLHRLSGEALADQPEVEIRRPDGSKALFYFEDRGPFLESRETVGEPHMFEATIIVGENRARSRFDERAQDSEHLAVHRDDSNHLAVHRDNAMRSAIVHVLADAAVSIAVISGLVFARAFGWLWMDPAAALIGAAVIVSWSFSLIRDTGAVLLDVNPEPRLAEALRERIETGGDELLDCHIWRLGPGHLGAILSIATASAREASDYRAVIAGLHDFSHLTIEVEREALAPDARSRRPAA